MPQLLDAVQQLGYTQPTPIQQQAIRPVLEKKDLIGCAQTGTGKTAAFAIPILQNLAKSPVKGHRPIRALVLTPTRELALQIKESFDDYGRFLPVRNTVIFGGVGQAPQVEALSRGVDVLVATPGRLNDLCSQGYVKLERVEYFVLDEADRMLDMGFIQDVRKVLAHLPQKRQTLLFSATMPDEIDRLAKQILHNPVRVEVTPVSTTVDAIRQRLYRVDKPNKRRLLLKLLDDHPEYDSVLVFTRTKHGADRVAKELGRAGVEAMAIHGNKSQTARQKALGLFKQGEIRVLVATDIAARGLDISGLSCVVNYELPDVPETYVHRIGRTGRAGRTGEAVSFCNFDEQENLRDIEKLIGKKLELVEENPWPMEILQPSPRQTRGQRASMERRQETLPGEKAQKAEPLPALKQEKRPAGAKKPKADNKAKKELCAEKKPSVSRSQAQQERKKERFAGTAGTKKKTKTQRSASTRTHSLAQKPPEIAAVHQGYSAAYWMESLPGERRNQKKTKKR